MTAPVSLLQPQTGNILPPPTVIGLSADEQALVAGMSTKLTFHSVDMDLNNSYYEGTQRLANLGVSIPDQLAGVRTVVDWPRICIDPLVQRCLIDGFRFPDATDVDSELWDHWAANDMNAEAPLSFLDALIYGRGYMIVGSPDVPGDSPVITVESPLNMTVTWDPRTRQITAAYQSFQVEGVFRAVLYLPNVTISMSREDMRGGWSIDDRDQHNFGEVPVIRLPNRARTANREGRSEITPAIRNTTDSAVRSLLGMEIAREFYSVPHRYGLGLSEADFMGADGTPKTAMQMSMNKFIAFEADENGNLPKVGQFQAFDPSVFTKIIDEHAKLMASYTQFPPAYFGQTTSANPASADAIRVAESGLERRATQVQNQFSTPLKRLMQIVWRFANDGAVLPDEMRRLEVDWVSAATRTPAATTDSIQKQVAMGAIPATSDVTMKELGWNGVQRARLEIDRKLDQGASVLAELANSLQAKQARLDTTVIHDINPAATQPQPNDGTAGNNSGQ